MLVKDIMTDQVRGTGADVSVRRAAQEMAQANVGALPVVRDQHLVGIITDRDIAVRVLGGGLDADRTTVAEAMTPGLFTVFADQEVAEAGQAMRAQQVRRAPVLDANQQLVGIVALGDIAVRGEDAELSGDILKGISEPADPPTPSS